MDFGAEKLVRLLIIDDGVHKAEQITSSLRATGMQIRAEFAEIARICIPFLKIKRSTWYYSRLI